MEFKIRKYIEPSGERRAILFDTETGLPDFWSTLYGSSQLRAKGASLSTQSAQLGSICILYKWAELRGINIESRISSREGFSRNEVDSLVTLLRSRVSDLPDLIAKPKVAPIGRAKINSSDIWKTLEEQPKQINASTFNDRLDYVSRYMTWLCDYLSDHGPNNRPDTKQSIAEIGEKFALRLSSMRSVEPNTAFDSAKDLKTKDIRAVLNLINPQSPLNPWDSPSARIRNFAIICVLLDTGLRTGELLSLKLKDIDYAKKGGKGLKVRRRQGSKDDPRLNQPGTKRDEREVPLSESAFNALDTYVSLVRNQIPAASKTEYLFVSVGNKSQGIPMSSITHITDKIREIAGVDLTPHKLRHTATWRYCMLQKKKGLEWDSFVERLIMKFGWKSPKSPSVRHYAKRFIKEAMFESSIREQDETNALIDEATEAARQEVTNG
jgi:integrase